MILACSTAYGFLKLEGGGCTYLGVPIMRIIVFWGLHKENCDVKFGHDKVVKASWDSI